MNQIVKMGYGNVTPLRLWAAWQISKNCRINKRLPRLTKFAKNVGMIKEEVKKTKPVWRLPYSYTKQNLSEMFQEIKSGTFKGDSYLKREIIIQCRERGIIQFSGEDKDAHTIPFQDIIEIPQQEHTRGHK